MEQLDHTTVVDFVLELLQCTRLDGKEVTGEVFDMEFAGNYLLLGHTLAFVVEVNYGSFFGQGGIGSLVERASASLQPSASSPEGSTPAS